MDLNRLGKIYPCTFIKTYSYAVWIITHAVHHLYLLEHSKKCRHFGLMLKYYYYLGFILFPEPSLPDGETLSCIHESE